MPEMIMMFVWLGIAVVLGFIEAVTLGLTTIWFAGGAVVAALFSLFVDSIWWQFAIFVVVSTILLIFTRPIVSKYLNTKITKTNVSALVGKKALVVSDISSSSLGEVKIDGKIWTAEMEEHSGCDIMKAETFVTVKGIEGVKLIVGYENDHSAGMTMAEV